MNNNRLYLFRIFTIFLKNVKWSAGALVLPPVAGARLRGVCAPQLKGRTVQITLTIFSGGGNCELDVELNLNITLWNGRGELYCKGRGGYRGYCGGGRSCLYQWGGVRIDGLGVMLVRFFIGRQGRKNSRCAESWCHDCMSHGVSSASLACKLASSMRRPA